MPPRRRLRGGGGEPSDEGPGAVASANGQLDLGTPLAKGPQITIVGLGPAGPELLSISTRTVLATATRGYLRTRQHPAAAVLAGVESFDHLYETAPSFDAVYSQIVEELVAAAAEAAASGGTVVYGVPGSPLVAERTVELLRADPRVHIQVMPATSFLDLAWDRLGIDPLTSGVRLVDGTQFAREAAGVRGPMLVAQCWNRQVLNDIKLSVDPELSRDIHVTILHHLGLPDEVVQTVSWWDMDRVVEPDHLTSIWLPRLGGPILSEVARLEDLVRVLRERCPWDREQTHASLAHHLLEEAYECLDSIEQLTGAQERLRAAAAAAEQGAGAGPDPADAEALAAGMNALREELGDVLLQVLFHACLATEEGAFSLADVARDEHAKLVARHPHVFGEVVAGTPAEVEQNWEALKRHEKGRESVTEGIPSALPALALAAKLQRKALAVGLNLPDFAHGRDWVAATVADLVAPADESGGTAVGAKGGADADAQRIGALLFGLADLARRMGVDPEQALRATALGFRDRIVESERTEDTAEP